MASNYYFLKLHYEILDDWKVGTLPDSLKWRFIQCLCVAGETQEDGFLPDLNQFAYRIRMEPTALTKDMARLAANQLVELADDENGIERWFVSNYSKRQAKITDAKRMKDYRQRQRQSAIESNDSVTDTLPANYDSVTIRNTDKNRIDIEESKNRVDVYESARTHAPMYDGHEENWLGQEFIDAMTAISKVVKGESAMMPTNLLEQVAEGILEVGAVDRIPGFRQWWDDNGHYKGRPALKSFNSEWDNYLEGVTLNGNGPQLTETERIAQRIEEKYNGLDN